MLRKCSKCDDVNCKSIETLKDEYVHVGGKYYHKDCFITILRTRKKLPMSEENATIETLRLVELMKKEQDENLLGMVAVSAYKDGTYSLSSSFDLEETYDLLKDALLDIEDGTLEASLDYSTATLQ